MIAIYNGDRQHSTGFQEIYTLRLMERINDPHTKIKVRDGMCMLIRLTTLR